jgi:hypothetical protein
MPAQRVVSARLQATPTSSGAQRANDQVGTNGLPEDREAVRTSTLSLVVQQPKHWSGELLAMTLLAKVSGSFSR